jgi:hypothetical protein
MDYGSTDGGMGAMGGSAAGYASPTEMANSEHGESMADGFTTPSPYHAGAEMPMMHLQGDKGPVFVQPVLDMGTNYMNYRTQADTNMIPWDSTSLAEGAYKGGDQEIRSTDHNGYRTPPNQGPTSA